MNLGAIDLNLLWVLHTVLQERSATRAARRLHVTQSAVSNALRRLRELFGDPLLTRGPTGLIPTPRAQQLAPLLASAVAQLEAAVSIEPPEDPAQAVRTFTLAASDGQQLHDVPQIVAALSRRRPRVTLRVVSIDYLFASGGLASAADVDVAFAPMTARSRGIHLEPLYEEEGVVVVREGHPLVKRQLTRAAFNACGHAVVHVAFGRAGEGHDATEKMLRKHGLHRRAVAIVPSFVAAGMIAARSDLLAAIPRRVAEALGESLPIRVLPFPIPALKLPMALSWHAKNDADPVARFFREVVVDVLRKAGEAPKLR